jgi:preprotein translocase subunit SecF
VTDVEDPAKAPSSATEQDELELEAELEADLAPPTPSEARERSKLGPFRRLYRGLTSFDFVGRRRIWFGISGAIIIIGMTALGVKGLNLGIDFKGGSTWTVLAPNVSQQSAVNAVSPYLSQPIVEILTPPSGQSTLQVQADLNGLSAKQQANVTIEVIAALAKLAHVKDLNKVSTSFVGPTWGSQITQKAIQALIAFFVAVVAYISVRFEPKMALAAFIAMLHDLAVTVGIYAIFGFQVTPDTVIAILTILGYSLYDTVVVFDRVRDNTKPFAAAGRMTYSTMVNLSMNQTLARSINTSMVAILPVLSVLLVGAELLGAVTLQNYGVALTVGLLSGAYSSIFIASPLLAILKEREPKYIAIRKRLVSKGERSISFSAQDAATFSLAAPAARTGAATRPTVRPSARQSPASRPAQGASTIPPQSAPVIAPRARKQKKR